MAAPWLFRSPTSPSTGAASVNGYRTCAACICACFPPQGCYPQHRGRCRRLLPCSLRPGPTGWEDGTTSFLDFPAVNAGMRFIQRLGGFPSVAGGVGGLTVTHGNCCGPGRVLLADSP